MDDIRLGGHGLDELPGLTHDELTALRNKNAGNRAAQNLLGPIEHRLFAKEETEKSALTGAKIAAMVIPYTMVKATAQGKLGFLPGSSALQLAAAHGLDAYGHPIDDPRTSDASSAEVTQAFGGVASGFASGLRNDVAGFGAKIKSLFGGQ